MVPVLSLWSSNADQVDWRIGVGALIAAVAFATALLLASRALLRDWDRAGCFASACVVLFFAHGLLIDALFENELLPRSPLTQAGLLLGEGLLAALMGRFFARTEFSLRSWAGLATAVSGALVLYSSCVLLWATISHWNAALDAPGAAMVGPGLGAGAARDPVRTDSAQLPDIYYLVLDGYAGEEVLRRVFGYDNSKFLAGLRARGFYVADESLANYAMTHLSLASVLNAAYLEELVRALGPESSSLRPAYAMLRRHWVGRFLRARGYRYVQIFTNWGGSERSDIADVGFSYVPGWLRSEFTGVLLRATMLRDLAPSVAGFHEFAFDAVRRVTAIDGPTFLFAHLLLPHEPYVFDRNGEVRANIPLHLRAHTEAKRKSAAGGGDAAYAGQVEYLNQRIEALVDDILQNSPEPPIIVIQGDHGWASHQVEPLSAEFVQARFPILNAFYVPEAVRARLYPAISPVNTFRVVLSGLFEVELPTLPDRSYLSWYDAPYQLRDVTSELRDPGARSPNGSPD